MALYSNFENEKMVLFYAKSFTIIMTLSKTTYIYRHQTQYSHNEYLQ